MKKTHEIKFCQQASRAYEALLKRSGGDPRLAAGIQAQIDAGDSGGWVPTVDARDSRITLPGMEE